MKSSETGSYRFKSFLLDASERQLSRGNEPVLLTPKAFDVLVYLVTRGGHLVHKDELMQSVWPDSFVDEVNIPRTIHTLRRALGEDENGSKFIETVPTKGYRFVAKVSEVHEPVSPKANGSQVATVVVSQNDADEKPPSPAAEPQNKTRFILFTVGFASAVFLILMLSFNFQSASSGKPGDVKAINGLTAKQYTTNDEAYRLYLLGSVVADKLTPKDAGKAIEAFEQVVQLDPNYAPAYARLANIHTAVAFIGGGGNPTEEYLKAKTAVEKALAIDDNLAEAHSYLGEIKTNFEWDFAGAEREHKRAIELNPNSAAARRMYALLLGFLGRSEESIAEIKTAIDLDPASAINHKIFEQNLYYARHYDEAIAEGKRTLEMDAKFFGVHDTLIRSYLMKGDNDAAFEWFLSEREQKEAKPNEIDSWKMIYYQSGWSGIRERQVEQAKEAEKNGNPDFMLLARLYTNNGNLDQAFIYLEKAFDKRMQGLTSLKASPTFDPLRSDPRFDDLVRRVGLK